MIKQLIFTLFIALIVCQDVICPAKLAAQCEQDLELGTYNIIQLFNHVTKLLNKKELTKLQTSIVLNFYLQEEKTAGLVSVKSQRNLDSKLEDANLSSTTSKTSERCLREKTWTNLPILSTHDLNHQI
jgi:hypothetical protein